MANTNLSTGKIYGAKEGTEKYYHEQAHLLFEDNCQEGNFIRSIQDLSFRYLVMAIALEVLMHNLIFQSFIVLLFVSSVTSEIYEEIWCWSYAKKTLKEKENVERRKEI